jgi:hypothetical protein
MHATKWSRRYKCHFLLIPVFWLAILCGLTVGSRLAAPRRWLLRLPPIVAAIYIFQQEWLVITGEPARGLDVEYSPAVSWCKRSKGLPRFAMHGPVTRCSSDKRRSDVLPDLADCCCRYLRLSPGLTLISHRRSSAARDHAHRLQTSAMIFSLITSLIS